MTRRAPRASAVLVVAALALHSAPAFPQPEAHHECGGVVVDRVTPGNGGDRAGLEPGMRLLEWRQLTAGGTPAGGALCSWWQFEELEVDRTPLGPVEVVAELGATRSTFTLPAGAWLVATRPDLPAELVAAIEAARGDAASEVRERVIAGLDEAIAEAGRARRPDAEIWLHTEKAQLLLRVPRLAEALAEYRAASDLAAPVRAARVPEIEGQAALLAGRFDQARAAYERALAWRAERAPDGLAVAATLRRLTMADHGRGDLPRGESESLRALELVRARAPGSWLERETLNTLGINAGMRGDLALAEQRFVASAEIDRDLDPENAPFSHSLTNLGIVARRRGDLDRARFYLLAALERPDVQGDPQRRIGNLQNLANVEADDGDFATARRYYEEALELVHEHDPTSRIVPHIQFNLGKWALLQGRLEEAQSSFEQAQRLVEQTARDSLFHAEVLEGLADLAAKRGEVELAEFLLRRALAIQRRLAPGRHEEARTLGALGQLARYRGDLEGAAKLLAEATRLLDQALESVGGGAVGSAAFRAKVRPVYRLELRVLAELGRFADAFSVSERSRARSFQELVLQRKLFLEGGAAAELDRERRELLAALDRAYRRLPGAAGTGAGGADSVRLEIDDLRSRYHALVTRARSSAPRLARLAGTATATGEQVRRHLPPGTLLLSYIVDAERTFVFVLTNEHGLSLRYADLDEESLAAAVAAAVDGLSKPAGAVSRGARDRALAELSDALLGPVKAELARARHVVVLADGPLHLLPLGALPDPNDGKRFLVESVSISTAPSASVLLELRERERSRVARTVVVAAGGHAALSNATSRGPDAGASARDALGRTLLPYAEAEARAISELYQGARLFLGASATETQLAQAAGNARILHLATHAEPDERFPLDSTIHLAPSAEDDGRLHAWEVLEQLELSADLVGLSGCETALGRQFSGEGLVGLTRSFHVAGAASVLASLWQVDDRSTALLMEELHRRLRAGAGKSEALRQAALRLLRGPAATSPKADVAGTARADFSDPYYWAPFVLSGDW